MDRRLQNNITALAATGTVLVAALVSASPLAYPAAAHDGSMNESGSGAAALLVALEHAGSEARDRRRIAMPYFTFLPRG